FAPSLVSMGPATVVLSHGELKITAPVDIRGPGASMLTIDASGNDPTPNSKNGDGSRVFDIDDHVDTNFLDVGVSGLTLTGADSSLAGGAVLSKENLALANDAITVNSAKFGGGISSSGGLTVQGCSISHNFADEGGGIQAGALLFNQPPTFILENSTVSG